MKNIWLTNRPVLWVDSVLFTIGCAVYIHFIFNKANNLLNIEIKMDSPAVVQKAGILVAEFKILPVNYNQTAALRNDSHLGYYVKLEAGGLERIKKIIPNTEILRDTINLNSCQMNFGGFAAIAVSAFVIIYWHKLQLTFNEKDKSYLRMNNEKLYL